MSLLARLLVLSPIGAVAEAVLAVGALVRPLSSVDAPVPRHVARTAEGLVAEGARVDLLLLHRLLRWHEEVRVRAMVHKRGNPPCMGGVHHNAEAEPRNQVLVSRYVNVTVDAPQGGRAPGWRVDLLVAQ